MPKPGERTQLDREGYVFVEYHRGCIVLDDGCGHSVDLDQTAMDAFDSWRAELDKDIELRKAAGF